MSSNSLVEAEKKYCRFQFIYCYFFVWENECLNIPYLAIKIMENNENELLYYQKDLTKSAQSHRPLLS